MNYEILSKIPVEFHEVLIEYFMELDREKQQLLETLDDLEEKCDDLEDEIDELKWRLDDKEQSLSEALDDIEELEKNLNSVCEELDRNIEYGFYPENLVDIEKIAILRKLYELPLEKLCLKR